MKVLLLNPCIPDYRVHIFNLLGEKIDLTVAHSGKLRVDKNLNFKQKILPLRKVGPFFLHPINLHKLCKSYEIIISEGNIRYIDRNFLILNPFRKYKWINWGIGVSASYKKKFDHDNRFNFIRYFIFKRADAQVFYSDYPRNKYIQAGFNSQSLFIANNTTYVNYSEKITSKKYKILFVGTLYKQKKIYELLEAYRQYAKSSSSPLPLEVIGDGSEYDSILRWIQINNLQDKIKLHGAIFNHEILEKHFREAYACISPGQAGLSVLTSMGYGTPYITRKDAITGGEIFNIQNGINGILYNESSELVEILKDIEQNPTKFLKLGENARKYYLEKRTPELMVKGLIDACLYVSKK